MNKDFLWDQFINGFNKNSDYVNKYDFKNTNPFYELKDDLLEYYFKVFNDTDPLTLKE